MLRSHHLLSLTLASSLLLCPSTAAADPGGSVALEVLGWDPVDGKVFVAQHIQEAGLWRSPVVGVFLLEAEDPSLLVSLDDPVDLADLPGGGDLRALRRALEPLEPVEPVGLEVRERLMASGPCADSPAPDWQPPCRDDRVRLAWLGQVQELRLTGWGGSEVLGAWAVPGTGFRLVVHSYLAQGGVLGQPLETALLFGPVKAPSPSTSPGHEQAQASAVRQF
ncbi:MAG: hypothetical protein ABIO70_36430 [Pseudomonadota bacterium]